VLLLRFKIVPGARWLPLSLAEVMPAAIGWRGPCFCRKLTQLAVNKLQKWRKQIRARKFRTTLTHNSTATVRMSFLARIPNGYEQLF
jgi:hypothetical protein